jgi:putative ATP-dependent endonuclease of OLD family
MYMRIKCIEVKNFRLLHDVSLLLEERTTLIVGRNNSGKTSLTELFRRLLSDKATSFRLEDFSLASHEDFWRAVELLWQGKGEDEIRDALPVIEVKLMIHYDMKALDLGALSECIVDLDPDCTDTNIVLSFAPGNGKVIKFLDGFAEKQSKDAFFRAIKDRITNCYAISIHAVDPNDATNRKTIEASTLTRIIQCNFINAQRGLDDTTDKDRDVLGKVLEVLFSSAAADSADTQQKTTAQELKVSVERIQKDIHENFNAKLTELLPAFSLFGYPGLSDPGLVTETTLDVERLLSNHTKVRYTGINGFTLPETYNGLGARNLVFILLQLHGFFRAFKGRPSVAGVHLIFIEEPEAHLHPQMQEVFIRQIENIAKVFEDQFNEKLPWPVQFVVSTHSPHMANEARFESMRYFMASSDQNLNGMRTTRVKDLRNGLGDTPQPDRDFLHQYLTLTRCDLFFADKAILIEGTSERLLLPRMIQKIDAEDPTLPKLACQYLTVMEVGGAYAHKFFKLLDFLDLRALIITDIDAVEKKGDSYEACKVSEGKRTSNGCLKAWFDKSISPAALIAKSSKDKTEGIRRLAYQIPEQSGAACGRSFEDAFILANADIFSISNVGSHPSELEAWELAQKQKKSAFALQYAIDITTWNVPRYIAEGLRWLASDPDHTVEPFTPMAIDLDQEEYTDAQMEVKADVE